MIAAQARLLPSNGPVSGRVSIIVPTRNSGRTLRACLEAARRQDHADVELIVVDNCSDDGSPGIARDLADRVVEGCGPERSTQRNRGAACSTGEFLVFVDSDQLLSREVVGEIVGTFAQNEALGALVIPELSRGQGFFAACRALEKRLYLGDPAVEAARAIRRTVFEQIDGFDEGLYGAEDFDLADRVQHAGSQIGRIAALVWHDEGRVQLRATFHKKRYYGRCLPQYFRGTANRGQRVARLSLVRGFRRLARDPRHAAGLVLLKLVDALGLLSGALAEVLHLGRRPTDQAPEPAAPVRAAAERYPAIPPRVPQKWRRIEASRQGGPQVGPLTSRSNGSAVSSVGASDGTAARRPVMGRTPGQCED